MSRSSGGRTFVVTGGSSGLGLEVAKLLARRGARVHLLARDQTKLTQAREAVLAESPSGVTVDTHSVDVSDPAAVEDAFAAIGDFDVLVTSAGVLTEGRFDQLPADDFRKMVETNFFGTVACVRAALPALKKSHGQVTIVSSVAGLLGVYGYTAYSASKHALVGFADSLRYELAADGVSVNVVCPGEFDSPMVESLDQHRSPQNRAHVLTIPKSDVRSVAAGVVNAVERDRPTTVPGLRARVAANLGRTFPGPTRLLGRRAVARATPAPDAAGHGNNLTGSD